MRKFAFIFGCGTILAVCAFLAAHNREAAVSVRLELVDTETGKKIGGMIRVTPVGAPEPAALPGLLDRLRGLKKTDALTGWCVVPADGAETKLARGKYRIEALSGLETVLAKQEFELTGDAAQTVAVKVVLLFRPTDRGWVAGNTHLHLQNVTKEQCEEYLRQVPAADGISVMFISYLERAEIDKAYVTNRYPIGDLKEFDTTGVLFNNGEEHRHNFGAWNKGYGHVMFLDIKELVKPVSLGPGIAGEGHDDRPLRSGIDDARKQGATVIWCHNTFGHEDVPDALAGRLDAFNVFDGGRAGTYEDHYYRYLNVGMRLPISTGTDWFIYDFSRVYAQVPEKLTVKSWLAGLKAGRNVATNGPILSLTVDGHPIGDTLKLEKPKRLRIVATGLGRHDFQKLQIVQNGCVILSEPVRKVGDRFECRIDRDVPVDGPSWFAARIESETKNELTQQLFAHTSPVYVEIAGQCVFDVDSGRALMRQMEESRADIRARGTFSDDVARDRLLGMYDDAIRTLGEQIGRRAK